MDVKKPAVIYISSDEEEDSGESSAAAGRGGGGGSSDEDCVILEEDPFKPEKVVNEELTDDSDDILVISEKGQVACRDYPHPRHICAKFPFDTTPHEVHCNKCYCYICDTIAPCLYWGKDNTLTHCNATDKIAFWKFRRENRKKDEQNVVPLVSQNIQPRASIAVDAAQAPPLPLPVSNSLTQNQVPSKTDDDHRSLPLMNSQNCNPRHLQHQKTQPFRPGPVLTSDHIVHGLTNLNLGNANTDPPCVLE